MQTGFNTITSKQYVNYTEKTSKIFPLPNTTTQDDCSFNTKFRIQITSSLDCNKIH